MLNARIIALTLLAMIAFAGNSLLCRVALKHTGIDATSFTTIRLISGALILWLLVRMNRAAHTGEGNWLSAFALFVYAAGFSLAYVSLPAATGALLLFGAVQATMIGHGIWKGERLLKLQVAGLMLAFGGLVGLVLPGLSAPPLSVLMFDRTSLDQAGFWYAVSSGALASGIGYAIWYTALPALKSTTAATVQLSVPVIAALGGILFLGEPMTLRLVLASVAILGGIALVIVERQHAMKAGV